jgi:DNA-binding response OmpR family regulator
MDEAQPPAGVSARILLVEYDERLGQVIVEYLGRNGLQTHWVRDGPWRSSAPMRWTPTCCSST